MVAVAIPPLPAPTTIHHHHQPPSSNTIHSTKLSPPPLQPSETVYTTLIQTYLNLLCYDNATFLAERYAASFPRSENAIYLLAYCYYRNGSPKSARNVLLTRSASSRAGGGVMGSGSSSNDTVGDIDLERTRSSSRYLLAKCCYDLGMYSESEETLLRHCREKFAIAISEGGGMVNGVKIRGNRNEAMDAWIVSSSSSSSSKPCPIPNGSAGLFLLGNICRKTNRRQRAIEYYRLSLKLDPFLWTSYEAICELVGPEIGGKKNDMEGNGMGDDIDVDDPNLIFGVEAPLLSPRAMMMGGGGGHGFGRAAGGGGGGGGTNDSTINASGQQQQQPLHSFQLNRYGTPSTPYSTFDNMKLGTYTNNTTSSSQISSSSIKQGFGVNFHLPATASTMANRGGATRGRSDSLPQTNLFAATPAIEETTTPAGPSSTAADTPNNPNDNGASPPGSAIGYANQVLDRARRVVAGLTYEPSPESVHHPGTTTTHRKKARNRPISAASNDLTFSSTPMPTSAASSGATPAPFLAGVSTVKGEKRALFSTNDDGNDGDDGDGAMSMSRKKTPKKENNPTMMTATNDHMMEGMGDDDRSASNKAAPPTTPGGNTAEQQIDSMTESHHVGQVLELLCCLGAAYKYLCQFRSQDALELFRELPPEQINTGWVQHQIGKAYFEMSDYHNAHRALLTMQKVEPHRIKGLDILSTTLWQLKKEVELSDLAQQVVDFDRMAPESWFVVGNCFSLQKEHETAITFFRRAIQLNPSYTYAHTLCGHEYTSNEDFEKAISCYRDAIRVDSRHYNAWYGLGAIYFRQEKFDLAEYHFQRALDINSQSSVLHCHLGMAQHQNGKTMEALDTLAGAFRLDPRNPQAHYQRATIFMTLDRPEDALAELEKVRSAAPKEASVHFNMGKVQKRLGQPAKAMRCFLTALDLDPKDNNLIKAAMDRLDEPDVEEEVSVF
ncbi:hypothetical protein ACHAXR_006563 [Thalassiosira sp. AJA248-18]